MIEELKNFAFTCDAQREDVCNFTTIVERTIGEKQAAQVAATRGWVINRLNEYCSACWADMMADMEGRGQPDAGTQANHRGPSLVPDSNEEDDDGAQ